MATKQSSIPSIELSVNNLSSRENSIYKLLFEFEYAIQQLRVENRSGSKKEIIIIAIDKILKIYFPDDYISFFSESFELLTDTEKKIFSAWMNLTNYQIKEGDFLLKNSFYSETKFIVKVLIDNKLYYLLLKNKNNYSEINAFIRLSFSTEVI